MYRALEQIEAARTALSAQCGFVIGVSWLAGLALLIEADLREAQRLALAEPKQAIDTDMLVGNVLVVRGGRDV